MKNYFLLTKQLLFFFCLFNALGITAQTKKNAIALINGTAHVGDGSVVESSIIVIKNNKIESVQPTKGVRLDYKSFDTVIDLAGKHIYPSLINANNILGLHDAFSVRATRDFSDVGSINPHIRSLIAYNTDNKIIPTIKTNGILYTQVTPRGGLISGSSSVMALEGWNWEDAVLKEDDGIHLNFPDIVDHSGDDSNDDKAMKHYQEEMNNLTKFFDDALAYYKSTEHAEKNLRFEAMKGVFSGSKNIYFHTDKAKDILSVITFSKKYELKKPVLVGAREASKVLQDIKKSNIPVMLVRVHDLPDKVDDDIDAIYQLPSLLQKEGILFCLQTSGDSEMEAMNSRNLPFLAGSAVTYGLTKEQALMSVSLNTAKIIGIANLIGSLEAGKLASLVVSEGDILDMKTSQIILAYIAGKSVNLTNQQTELYIKYKNKYGIK